jgi:hypothetical protein
MLGKVDDRYGLLSIAFAGPFHCDFAARIARTAKTISQPRFPIFLPYFCFALHRCCTVRMRKTSRRA